MYDVLEDIKLSSVEEFRYFGSIIHQDRSCHRELGGRTSEGIKVIHMLNSVLWNSNIPTRTKRLIFASIMQSPVARTA